MHTLLPVFRVRGRWGSTDYTDVGPQASHVRLMGVWKKDGLPFRWCPSPPCPFQGHCFVLRTWLPYARGSLPSDGLSKGGRAKPRRGPLGLLTQDLGDSSAVLLNRE